MDIKKYSEVLAGIGEKLRTGTRGLNRRGQGQKKEAENAQAVRACGNSRTSARAAVAILVRLAAAILLIILELEISFTTFQSYAVCVAAFLIAGYDIILSAVKSAAGKDIFNEKLLMSLSGIAAVIIGRPREAVLVIVLYQAGSLLREWAAGKSRDAITALVDMRPDKVRLITEEGSATVQAGDAKPGDVFLVLPGERIALDGVIVSGSSELDTSPLTGDSAPRRVSEGDRVQSGCVNIFGGLRIRATAASGESTAQRAMDIVGHGVDSAGKTEKRIAKFVKFYTLALVGLALFVGVLIPLVFTLDFSDWLYRALVLLVISCPCSLLISIPITYFAGIGGASAKGILFRGANALDIIARATTAIFDKTGTLTTGQFQIISTEPIGIGPDDLLFLAAYGEANADDPVARAIVNSSGVNVDQKHIADFREKRGRGILTRLSDGRIIIAGSTDLIDELRISHPFGKRDCTSILICLDQKCVGCINLTDKVKPDAKKAVADLVALGVDRVVMITGDSQSTAQAAAAELGIPEYHAECMPDMKTEKIRSIVEMQGEGEKAVFIGGGMNDAAFMTAADIGVAMGGLGADTAADVIIMSDRPSKAAEAISAARSVNRVLRQNIVFLAGAKALMLVLGVAGFAAMWLAVSLDMAAALLAIINAMRAFNAETMDYKDILKLLTAKK